MNRTTITVSMVPPAPHPQENTIRPDMERSALKVAAQVERRTEHQARTISGGTVADLRALAATGFRAGAILAESAVVFRYT